MTTKQRSEWIKSKRPTFEELLAQFLHDIEWAGVEAHIVGHKQADCPYPDKSIAARFWLHGWQRCTVYEEEPSFPVGFIDGCNGAQHE